MGTLDGEMVEGLTDKANEYVSVAERNSVRRAGWVNGGTWISIVGVIVR